MVAGQLFPPDVLAPTITALAEDAGRSFGVSLMIPFLDSACVDVAAAGAPLVELFFGDPDPSLVDRVHRGGALASWRSARWRKRRPLRRRGAI